MSVLLLGAGRVAGPTVRYLAGSGIDLAIASNTPERARALLAAAEVPAGDRVFDWAAGNLPGLAQLLRGRSVVISLLPAEMHVSVAELCIETGCHLVTASYAADGMRALDSRSRRAGVVLLNEMGLDPGIDHMAAMRAIDRLRGAGASVSGLVSYCGGLPAPEANDNPWGYKLSWNPVGVLRATLAPARYVVDGQLVEVPPEQLFDQPSSFAIGPLEQLEGYPNRDALPYARLYGLRELRTLYRGTLRYPGWCESMRALQQLGLLSLAAPEGRSWSEVTAGLLARRGHPVAAGQTLRDALAEVLGQPPASPLLTRLDWLGLLADRALPDGAATLLEALAATMEEKLTYGSGERDVIVLHHDIFADQLAEDAAGQGDDERARRLQIRSNLVHFGTSGGETAMALTVGLPVAIAARLLLQGEISAIGVQIPVTQEIYRPVLAELEQHGMTVDEQLVEVE